MIGDVRAERALPMQFLHERPLIDGVKSDNDVSYNIEDAKKGKLIDTFKGMPNIPLLGVPPTRLSGPCSRILRELLEKRGYKLITKNVK